MNVLNRLTRWAAWALLIIACVTGLCVIPGLTVIVALFAWFWWAQPLPEPLDEFDAELLALLDGAR